ncbi:MAG: ribonuclease H-like domain-containing protein [Verrucomicrobiae bacterium]|nr:ribonuclease H-like domain-containing protein [Verrucomicrobiae bacterium]
MKNVVYFDIETQKSFDEIGGRSVQSFQKLLMSVGVTYSTKDRQYRIFHEGTVQEMIEQLRRADLVVGHNIIGFDYPVLTAYTPLDFALVPTLDTMADLEKILHFRLSLDSIAKATIGNTKTAGGLDAIRWWKKGDPESLLKIAEYCCYDVKLTRLVHEYGQNHGELFYADKFGQKRSVKVKW